MNNDKADFTQGSILKKLIAFMIPVLGALILQAAYGAVDLLVVGRFGSTSGLSAVSTGSQVLNLVTFVVIQFAMGITVLIARYLGEKKPQQIGAVVGGASIVFTIISAVLFVVMVFFARPIAILMQAPEAAVDQTASYIRICGGGIFFIVAYNLLSSIFRGLGDSQSPLLFVLVACIVNVIGDLALVAGLHMDAAGAAIATTIGNVMASAYYLWYFVKKSQNFSILPKDFSLENRLAATICSCGLPTAIFSMLMSLSTIILNQILVAYGNAPVASIGIVFKANMFITFLQMGLANGVQPLLGYNFGSGDTKRFHAVESYTKKCCLIVGILATALFFFFRRPIIQMFINDEEVIQCGVRMLVAYMLSGPVIGILFVNMNCMQSAGKALPATILSILRQGVLLIPILYLLNGLFGLNGVIFGQALTDYIAVVLSIGLWRGLAKKMYQ